MDNCLLMYSRIYEHDHEYSYDLETLGEWYALYGDLMAHWKGLFGDRILDVRYEDLVRNPHSVSERVAEFCGIEYDSVTVQHSFNTEEIGIFNQYDKHLGALHKALEDQ